MTRIAAKYGVATRATCPHSEYLAGEVTDRMYGDAKKVEWKQNDALTSGLGITVKLPNIIKDDAAFRILITHAAHDVHGLSEHGKEADDFRTGKLVKRSVRLQFDDAATASRAFNAVLEIDTATLKTLMESETLQDLLAQKLDLFAVPFKTMKPMNPWQAALSIPS